MASPTATLVVTCPERRGLVAAFAGFVSAHGGNIVQADHHSDFEAELFLSRIEWEVDHFGLGRDELKAEFAKVAADLDATWKLSFSDVPVRLGVFVSKQDHCLVDLLWRCGSGELNAEVSVVVGNHPQLESTCTKFGAPFVHVAVNADAKREAEHAQLEVLKDRRVDLVVLAKYMQVLSAGFLAAAPPTINIHHSFLPAFIGDRPYHKAHARGVKIIGATAHYATSDLDEGPIIEQEVTRVSHRDNVQDLVRRGRDVERLALSRAVRLHTENRVLVYGNRTVVFD